MAGWKELWTFGMKDGEGFERSAPSLENVTGLCHLVANAGTDWLGKSLVTHASVA